MTILASIMLMGFFTGLKTAARQTDDKTMTAVGWAICFLMGIFQMAQVSEGRGEMFWAVTLCVFISQIAVVVSLTAPRRWLDIMAIVVFVAGWAVIGISLVTLAIGGYMAALTYPMAGNYTFKGDWMKMTKANIIKVVVLFGMVLAWIFIHNHFTANIYTVIRWLTR